VRSRILYEQMLGRGTRLCPSLGPGGKECFRIFDAVDLYAALEPFSAMKPVAVNPSFTFQQLAAELGRLTEETAQKEVLDQLLARLQRKRRHLEGPQHAQAAARFAAAAAGMSVAECIGFLREQSPAAAAAWWAAHGAATEVLDRASGLIPYQYISEHADTLREVAHGYGEGQERPADYLEGFGRFLRENLNKIPALVVVTQRPRELTRQQLRELRLALEQAGYSEQYLRTAWREMTNEDIAASIIGFIRQQALGEPLVPYAERVDRALKKILARRPWTAPQRKWLERIGAQLKLETIVDREALDREPFERHGGFAQIDRAFDGQLEQILGDLGEALWADAG
jgi:type I restriction enzyme R subunit